MSNAGVPAVAAAPGAADLGADVTAVAPARTAAAAADPARLAAVRATGLLDTEVEEAFDRLTRLAVRLVGVPAAFVSLVDADRDFYKSACGFGEPLASARELTGLTFCHYTVQHTTPLVIPDTAADPVYRDVPTVRTLGVAAYVGVPLVVGGQAVGAFCAIDTRPRAWTAGEVEILTELAASAQRELDLRGAAAAAEAAAAQLRAQQAELETSNHQLQEQAAELDAQAEELQATAAHLEERTEAVEAARAAAEAERARAEGILEGMADAYFALDADFRLTAVNGAMERGSGLARAHLLGRVFWELFPGAVGTAFERHFRVAVADRAEAHFTHDYSDGRLDLVVEEDVYPAPGGGLAAFWRDITPRVRAAAERERLLAAERAARTEAEATRAAAESANAAKSQFLANMSHELRTPLNAIGGYTQLLELGLHGPVTDDQRGALARVQAAQRRLLALINDVLNYAKLEGGRVEYDMAVVDVRDVVADVSPLVEPQLAAKGLAFAVPLPEGPCLVWADRAKLGQVLVNLLSNAAKFTDGGLVTVDVATRPGAAVAGDPAVFLRVADTGRGIAHEKQAAVFDPFIQVQTGYARTQEGTGLGLAISRDLARGMGGDLRVRSVPGEGSVFTVVLRRAAAADGAPPDHRSHEERRAEADRRDGEDRRQDVTSADDPSAPDTDDLTGPLPSAPA